MEATCHYTFSPRSLFLPPYLYSETFPSLFTPISFSIYLFFEQLFTVGVCACIIVIVLLSNAWPCRQCVDASQTLLGFSSRGNIYLNDGFPLNYFNTVWLLVSACMWRIGEKFIYFFVRAQNKLT